MSLPPADVKSRFPIPEFEVIAQSDPGDARYPLPADLPPSSTGHGADAVRPLNDVAEWNGSVFVAASRIDTLAYFHGNTMPRTSGSVNSNAFDGDGLFALSGGDASRTRSALRPAADAQDAATGAALYVVDTVRNDLVEWDGLPETVLAVLTLCVGATDLFAGCLEVVSGAYAVTFWRFQPATSATPTRIGTVSTPYGQGRTFAELFGGTIGTAKLANGYDAAIGFHPLSSIIEQAGTLYATLRSGVWRIDTTGAATPLRLYPATGGDAASAAEGFHGLAPWRDGLLFQEHDDYWRHLNADEVWSATDPGAYNSKHVVVFNGSAYSWARTGNADDGFETKVGRLRRIVGLDSWDPEWAFSISYLQRFTTAFKFGGALFFCGTDAPSSLVTPATSESSATYADHTPTPFLTAATTSRLIHRVRELPWLIRTARPQEDLGRGYAIAHTPSVYVDGEDTVPDNGGYSFFVLRWQTDLAVHGAQVEWATDGTRNATTVESVSVEWAKMHSPEIASAKLEWSASAPNVAGVSAVTVEWADGIAGGVPTVESVAVEFADGIAGGVPTVESAAVEFGRTTPNVPWVQDAAVEWADGIAGGVPTVEDVQVDWKDSAAANKPTVEDVTAQFADGIAGGVPTVEDVAAEWSFRAFNVPTAQSAAVEWADGLGTNEPTVEWVKASWAWVPGPSAAEDFLAVVDPEPDAADPGTVVRSVQVVPSCANSNWGAMRVLVKLLDAVPTAGEWAALTVADLTTDFDQVIPVGTHVPLIRPAVAVRLVIVKPTTVADTTTVYVRAERRDLKEE